MKTGMIMLASEQIWPNLLGLLHFHQQFGLEALRIYHSDAAVSKGPALRLAQWCRETFPHWDVQLSTQNGVQPEDVAAQLCRWLEAGGDDWNWIINATGGIKLMSFGLSDFVQVEPVDAATINRVRLVYLELTAGKWYELCRGSTGAIQSSSFAVSSNLADALPLTNLLQLQQGGEWSPQLPQAVPVLKLVEQGIPINWNWREMFVKTGLSTTDSTGQQLGHGFLFEQFVAGSLLAIGLGNVAINVKLGELAENDVVCQHHGRIYFLDCKLTTSEQAAAKAGGGVSGGQALITEINDVAQRLRKMGGLAATGVLLRPNRDCTSIQHEFAQDSRVEIWDRTRMRCFFSELGRLFGIEENLWPDEIKQSHALLCQQVENCAPVFSSSRPIVAGRSNAEDFFNLDGLLHQLAKEEGHARWEGYFSGSEVFVRLRFENGFRLTEQQLRTFLSVYGFVQRCSITPNSASCRLANVSREKRLKLRRALAEGQLC